MGEKMEFKNEIESTISEIEQAPSSSSSSTTTPRTFHIYFEDWAGRGARITDSDKQTHLYQVSSHIRRPNVVFHRPDSSDPIATAKFHALSPNIDVTLHGRDLTLKPKSKWKQMDYEFASNTFGGTVTWTCQSPWVVLESVCVDDKGRALARFVPVMMAKHKVGKIEFVDDGKELSQEEVDEIVVTGVTMLNFRLMTSTAAAAGAAA